MYSPTEYKNKNRMHLSENSDNTFLLLQFQDVYGHYVKKKCCRRLHTDNTTIINNRIALYFKLILSENRYKSIQNRMRTKSTNNIDRTNEK